ncbi:MAG: helix-turn-helix domain-containing protein [Cyanobacteria bacterium P01_D01_bin.50]
MTQNNPKIQGKFYPLQHEEWLRACRELNSAELDVLYYLKTINPSGEKRAVTYNTIASDLKKNKSTVSRAIQALKDKNWLPEWFELQPAEQINTVTFEEVES